jgi:hypothetical protein
MTEKSEQRIIAKPPKNVLYVVLHGLICLIDDKKNNQIPGIFDQERRSHFPRW